jgi:hypothetical protein
MARSTETRRLLNLHTRVTRTEDFHTRWSRWRRRHQARARRCDYARRTRGLSLRL